MPINFKSFTDCFFPPSVRTDAANAAEAGKGRFSSSFNAMRNSAWAKKCADFDPVKMAQNFKNDPRTKKAMASAKKGLDNLSRQMAAMLKSMRTQLNNSGLSGTYQATVEEHRINGQWRAFLPPGAVIQPGSTFDPKTRMQRISWHKDGVIWTAAYNLNTGERTSGTVWGVANHEGWQHSQTIDHLTGIHWNSYRNAATGQHTSQTQWSAPDAEGWRSADRFDHQTKTNWKSYYNDKSGGHYSRTAWSKPNQDGVESRTSIDHKTKTRWHETYNARTREHLSKTDWSTDHAGVPRRTVWNHQTGQTYFEHGKPAGPSKAYDQSDFSFNMNGRSAQELTVESLGILGLDKTETDKATIKKRYRKLAIQCHPDKMAGQSAEVKKKAEEDFKKLGNAYEFLMSDKFPAQEGEG